MKLTIVTIWNEHHITAVSELPTDSERKKSCLLQTQEMVYNIFGIIPSISEIFLHLKEFHID